MKKKGVHSVQKSKNIPDINSIWERIDERIFVDGLYHEKNKESLQHALESLPVIKPDTNIWSDVELELSRSRHTFILSKKMFPYIAAIASILLLFGIFYFNNAPTAKITYSTEILEENDLTEGSENSENTEELISRLCSAQPVQCQNPDFKKLKSELEYLLEEKQKLFNPDESFILSPERTEYEEFINNQINDLTHRIIKFLSS